MYDDRLFDTIMKEMMSEFGADVRTDEGSLAYNACVKIAEKLEEVYGDMDELNDNILPDTQDEAHLIEYGRERGIEYAYATAPIVKGTFQQEIEIGERFTCNDYTYEVTELISGYEYKLKCDTEGVEANANLGELEPLDYVDDYQGGQITEVIMPGKDDEDIEKFRKKVIDTFKSNAFGGNKAYYRNYINSLPGVGGCKPKRREPDSPWINIHIIDSDYNVPSETLVDQVQTAVDPEQNSGEGDGMAPFCHNVKIYPVEGSEMNITTNVTFEIGYSVETSQSLIENGIKEYLNSLCQEWQSREFDETIVRVSQIEAKILNVDGELDVSNTTLNGSTENAVLDFKTIPVFGGVTINV